MFAGHADFRGRGALTLVVNVPGDHVSPATPAVAAITPLESGLPYPGPLLTVHTVSPFLDRLVLRVNIDARNEVDFRVYFLVARNVGPEE